MPSRMLTWVQVCSWFSKDLSLPFSLSSLSCPWNEWEELARLGQNTRVVHGMFCSISSRPPGTPSGLSVWEAGLFQEVKSREDDKNVYVGEDLFLFFCSGRRRNQNGPQRPLCTSRFSQLRVSLQGCTGRVAAKLSFFPVTASPCLRTSVCLSRRSLTHGPSLPKYRPSDKGYPLPGERTFSPLAPVVGCPPSPKFLC